MSNLSPEKKYPAINEDIDTIITGLDGKDYIVDVIDGIRQWTLYLPEEDDEIIIERTLQSIDIDIKNIKKEISEPVLLVKIGRGPTKYQHFLKEQTTRLKTEFPAMTSNERKNTIHDLWEASKSSKSSKSS
jgi:hypothetical protein